MGDNNGEEQSTVTVTGEKVESKLSWLFSMDDDAIELSEFLEASEMKTYPMKVKIIDDPCWHPLIFQTAASYITINGNEELCGSSFSDSDTSYMAGIGGGGGLVVGDGGAWDEARWWMEMEGDGNCLVNASTGDDDMLAVFEGDDGAQAR
ncbi:hypothetical protein L1987_70099 [Smallanthus sonchifolius]|uniref:Uncharacterized protein n=1 Tax=Smallanthus sonchifolius TaxID=185202 RepID=A0ACB9ANQ6_9ASTR|nr:hypothetical protein L1987_70099 [Smallanthus sonchifolius]